MVLGVNCVCTNIILLNYCVDKYQCPLFSDVLNLDLVNKILVTFPLATIINNCRNMKVWRACCNKLRVGVSLSLYSEQ